MLAMQWLWMQWPRQIASDLSQYHNRRIADWHRGRRDEHGDLVLGSYELMELLDQLPDESRFRTAIRGGEVSAKDAVQRHIANELSLLRATYYVVNGGKKAEYEPFLYKSIAQHKDEEEREKAVEEMRDSVFDFADASDRFAELE